MERQLSFSFNKSTRLLAFSFTLFSSLLFLFILLPYVFTYPPSLSPGSHLPVNPTLADADNSTFLSSKLPLTLVKSTISTQTHFQDSAGSGTQRHASVASAQNSANILGAKTPAFRYVTHSRESANTSKISSFNKSAGRGGAFDVPVVGIGAKSASEAKAQALPPTLLRNSSDSVLESEPQILDASKCDVSRGRWVLDGSSPLYRNSTCPFIDEGFNCQANGRLDENYMKWRWQPHGCNIPRFNATKMLELLRGKRLVFVGDSINRNQWESMLCLLSGAIKDPKRVYESHGRKITKQKGNYNFKILDYQCSVEYYVTHFLVHEGKARVGQKRVQTLRIDTIDRGSSRWKGADILVFNTAHWWTHYKTKAGVNYYQEGEEVHHHLDVSIAFRRALTTWASWVDRHINPSKTRVYFRSSSPSHFSGGQWNSGGHCRDIQPLDNVSSSKYPEKNVIAEEVIKQMKTPVTILNVTSLSEFRIDGHPSIYGGKRGQVTSSYVEDCSHWCLPGVPDIWNQLLYFHLLSRLQSVSLR